MTGVPKCSLMHLILATMCFEGALWLLSCLQVLPSTERLVPTLLGVFGLLGIVIGVLFGIRAGLVATVSIVSIVGLVYAVVLLTFSVC